VRRSPLPDLWAVALIAIARRRTPNAERRRQRRRSAMSLQRVLFAAIAVAMSTLLVRAVRKVLDSYWNESNL
jgi:hypothetical protein